MKGAFWMHAMQRYLRVSQRLYLEGAWVLNGRRWMGSAMPRLASSSSSSPKAKTKAESVVTVLQLPRLAGTSKRIMEEHPDKDESNSAQLQTPLAREISALRAQYPDHLVLVQVGSFYEIYEPDAKLEEICNLLNIRIAQKRVRASSETLRFAGFPVSRAKEYLDLLLRNGYTIALADQTGKDSQSKTKNFIRSVTRILSPGTILQDSSELEMSDNHFLLCVTVPPNASALTKSTKIGLCWVDITTGEFFLSETSASQLSSQVSRIQPVEVLLSKDYRTLVESSDSLLGQVFGQDRQDKSFFITYRDSDIFDAPNDPLSHWITQNDPCKALKPTRVLEDFTRMEVRAGSALLAYIGQNFPQTKPSFRQPIDVSHETHMLVDYTTLQALEITKTSRERTKVGSLLHRIDKTLTAAGGRLIAARLKSPSLSIPEINRRLDLIQLFYDDTRLTHDVRHLLLSAKDVERSLQRLHMETGGPSDFMNIILTLETVLALSARLKEKIASSSTQSMDPSVRTSVERMISQLGSFKDLVAKYSEFLEEEAFRIGRIENPGCIRTGFHQGLDTLRESKASMLVQKERLTKGLSAMLGMTEFSLGLDQKHGPVLMFPRLRIPVKKVVEASLDKSEDFEKISRRSPSNLTYSYNQWTKLFTHLEDIENRMVKLENAIFTEACQDLRDGSLEITEMMQQLAELDASCALAYVARESGYVRPTFTDSAVLDIQGGRHPVVEFSQLHRHHSYVKNDCHVGGDESIWLLTGANMGGKSTFLRQW